MRDQPRWPRRGPIVASIALMASVAFAAPASALQQSWGAITCSWSMHAYVEVKSSGTQELEISGTDGAYEYRYHPYSITVRTNYLNSPTRSSAWSYAYTSASSWSYATSGCSW